MRGKRCEICSHHIDIKWYFSEGLDRVDVQQAARRMDDPGDLRHRLDDAGLVIGGHHGHQRRRPGGQQGAELVEVHHSVRHADLGDAVERKAPARKHRGVLDRRHHKPLDGLARGAAQPRRQRQRIGFGAAGREDDVPGQRTDGGRHLRPCVLDHPPGAPALGMDRGRIAAELSGSRHGLARLGAKRGRRIPVEIHPVRHCLAYYPGWLFLDADRRGLPSS